MIITFLIVLALLALYVCAVGAPDRDGRINWEDDDDEL